GYADLAAALTADGIEVRVVGGPGETEAARAIVTRAGLLARDFTATDLRQGILAIAGSDLAVSNDSGLLHVAAATGVPTIGIFGPTSPWHWAPLNPLAAAVQPPSLRGTEMPYHSIAARDDASYIASVPLSDVLDAVRAVLTRPHSSQASS
ncbi:MAG: glycosyltransferase family 9 protein, partial [Xanthobacteraceae bacterium]